MACKPLNIAPQVSIYVAKPSRRPAVMLSGLAMPLQLAMSEAFQKLPLERPAAQIEGVGCLLSHRWAEHLARAQRRMRSVKRARGRGLRRGPRGWGRWEGRTSFCRNPGFYSVPVVIGSVCQFSALGKQAGSPPSRRDRGLGTPGQRQATGSSSEEPV